MFVGVAKYTLQIPEASSLKARRHVVRSFKERLKAHLPVSVAEVGDVQRYQVAEIGIAVVAGEAARCDQIMAQVTHQAETLPDAVLAEVRTQVLPFGAGGRQLPERWLSEREAGAASKEFDDLPWGRAGAASEPKQGER